MTDLEKIILEIERKIKSIKTDLMDVNYDLLDYTRKADCLSKELQDFEELKAMVEKIVKNQAGSDSKND